MFPEIRSKFYHLKDFANFLLQEHLEEFILEIQHRAGENNFPLIRLLPDFSKEQLREYLTRILSNFLLRFTTDNPLENSKVILDKWKANELPHIPREKLEASDLILSYSIRKQSMITLLSRYTSDIGIYTNIILELEDFHVQWEKLAFDTYISIKKEEEALKNREIDFFYEFSELLIEGSIDGIMTFNKDLIITSWNKALEINNKKKDEVIGKYFFDVFPNYKTQDQIQLFEDVLRGKTIKTGVQLYRDRAGFFDAVNYPIRKNDNEIIGGVSIVRDVTEQKEREDRLIKNQLFIEKISNTMPCLVTIYDVQTGQYLYVNRSTEELLGYASEEFIQGGIPFIISLVYPEDLNQLMEQNQAALEKANKRDPESDNNSRESFEYRMIHKTGSTVCLHTTGVVFDRDETGKVKTLLNISIDITQRKKAEKDLEEANNILLKAYTKLEVAQSELKVLNNALEDKVADRTKELKENALFLSSIIDQSPVSTWIADAEGTQIRVNEACLKLFGVEDPEAGIGKYNLFKDELLIPYRDEINSVFKEGKIIKIALDYNVSNVSHIQTSGVPVSIVSTIFPVKDGSGNIINAVIQHEDITLRKRAEEEKDKFNKELIKINGDLDNFIYTASHDLKSPISNIEGLISTLKDLDGSLNKDSSVVLDMMSFSIEKFKNTIFDLTEIAKIQKLEPEDVKEVNFAELLEDVKFSIQNLIIEVQPVINIDFAIAQLKFSQKNLRSVLYNLVSNAIKYRKADNNVIINISTEKKDNYTILSVNDNGLGIPASQHEKIFTMFKRVHDHVEGTGLGLYLVKRMVENAGGKIEVESEVGVGSSFRVFLPES